MAMTEDRISQKPVQIEMLIGQSGYPSSWNIWMAAGNHELLQKAIRANRVLTLHRRLSKGRVGFHPNCEATYLIFPKRLKALQGREVLGIDGMPRHLTDAPIIRAS